MDESVTGFEHAGRCEVLVTSGCAMDGSVAGLYQFIVFVSCLTHQFILFCKFFITWFSSSSHLKVDLLILGMYFGVFYKGRSI